MSLQFIIREIHENEVEDCISLFQQTVHSVNSSDYTKDQLDAWAPLVEPRDIDNYPYWKTLLTNFTYVADYNNSIIGFGDISKDGYLDRLFVHKDFQGLGIATSIVKKLEDEANKRGVKEITTHASITAKPFFEKMGYKVIKEQQWPIRGVKLTNFVMKKKIS